nr:hypothetical protein [uncultured Holophaga sp.]
MSYTTEIIHGGTGLLRIWHGEVPIQEMLDAARNFLDELPDPARLTHAIMDLSDVSRVQFDLGSLMEVLKVTRESEEKLNPGFMAVVVPGSLLYGLARMYQGYSHDRTWKVGVFRTLQEAEAWIREGLGAL